MTERRQYSDIVVFELWEKVTLSSRGRFDIRNAEIEPQSRDPSASLRAGSAVLCGNPAEFVIKTSSYAGLLATSRLATTEARPRDSHPNSHGPRHVRSHRPGHSAARSAAAHAGDAMVAQRRSSRISSDSAISWRAAEHAINGR